MVFISILNRKINQWVGPFLLRNGIKLRAAWARSDGRQALDHPWLDQFTLIPFSQRLVTMEIHDQLVDLAHQSQQHEDPTGNDQSSSATWWNLWGLLPVGSRGSEEDETAAITGIEDDTSQRLQILERCLRPALIPTERWLDVRRWQSQSLVISWARVEYLNVVHGKVALRARQQLWGNTGKKDVPPLPTSGQIRAALHLQDWSIHKTSTSPAMLEVVKQLGGEFTKLDADGTSVAVMDESTSMKGVPIGDVLEAVGGMVKECGPLNAFCEQTGCFQVWSKEFIRGLGDYLRKRGEEHKFGDTVILDVGAGDGVLSHHLRTYCNQTTTTGQIGKYSRKSPTAAPPHETGTKLRIIATDDQSWRIPPKAKVESLCVDETLAKYAIAPTIDGRQQQVIVLCSWMPMGEDWTGLFRAYRVDEYILIGEADDGQCGHDYLTWGNQSGDLAESEETEDSIPLYQIEGYERRDLDFLLPYQFSRYDTKVSKTGRTVSFRRRRLDG